MGKIKKKVSNDATSTIIGFEYQKTWALKCCLEAAPNATIYIECYGDVCDKNVMFETKHRLARAPLSSQSVDFWKTLKNLVDEYELLACCSRFILKTTQKMFRDEKWSSWNTMSSKEKLELLIAITPCDSIKAHYERVTTADNSILLDILSKFEIASNADNISELITNIQLHNALKAIPEQNRVYVLHELLGYITKCAIDNLNLAWQVDINSFINEFQRLARIYNSTEIQFPRKDKVILDKSNLKNYIFIKQLKKIGYDVKIESATQHFFRSSSSQISLLKDFPNLAKPLDDYDDDISDELFNIRTTELDGAKEGEYSYERRHFVAKQVFDKCMSIPLREINGVKGTAPYYQKGRMHSFVEKNEFNWTVEENEF